MSGNEAVYTPCRVIPSPRDITHPVRCTGLLIYTLRAFARASERGESIAPRIARGGGNHDARGKKYRENFIKHDKNIARILSNQTKISREFYQKNNIRL